MSKVIQVTPEMRQEVLDNFQKKLATMRVSDGKFSFSYDFKPTQKKATIYYTKDAWEKQCALLREFDKEVAWYGVSRRDEDETKDVYWIEDILVYPQVVGPATVSVDLQAMDRWPFENMEDDRFNHLFTQCHSHVNMGTSPSAVDLKFQQEELATMTTDRFQIFMIWNKSFQSTKWIYDLQKNVLFENADITVLVEGQEALQSFLKEAKEQVKGNTYRPVTPIQQPQGGTAKAPAAAKQDDAKKAAPATPAAKPAQVVTNAVSGAKTAAPKTAAPLTITKKPKAPGAALQYAHGTSYLDDDDPYDTYMEEMYGQGYRDPFYYSSR